MRYELSPIQSSLQRIEQELRETKLRMVWQPRATAPELPPTRIVTIPPEPKGRPEPAPKRGAYRSTHTGAGPEASKRMTALLVRTGLSGVRLAEKLGTHQTTVSMIGRGRLGISRRLDEAMSRLESR